MDIFLSRPTWIDKSFGSGLEVFISKLKTMGVSPRTVGVTDYPSKSPLDEVVELMNMCKGAIVLGYPQLDIEVGILKNKKVTNMRLATEWNHMEASLAFALNLPLLVIHHTGVSRGVFDRGTISNFIYERDLTEPTWCFKPDIEGALENWLNKCKNK